MNKTKEFNKTMINNLLNISITKKEDYKNLNMRDKTLFMKIEREFFAIWDKLNIPFQNENEIFIKIGYYVDNHKSTYLTPIMNECLNLMEV